MTLASATAMTIEKNLQVATRDGSPLATNVFRPEGDGSWPVILCMSPYGTDLPVEAPKDYGHEAVTGANGVWETGDPDFWVPKGYAMVRVDSRGAFRSPGVRDFLSRKEQEDYYDMVEWCGTQSWSTGKVGLLGVSFYAMNQWLVAALQPPHLAAMVPWEGMVDLYREWARHGGIYANFTDFWWRFHYTPHKEDEKGPFVDWRREFRDREFDSDWYRERTADLSKITVPLLSAGNWGAFHMHLRGNIEGFQRTSSKNKRLFMFTGSHIGPFYSDWGKAEQLRFLDRWLRDVPNGAENDAPIRLAIRHGAEIQWRDEYEWPLARTQWARYFLDAQSHSIAQTSFASAASTSYRAPDGKVSFDLPPIEQNEIEITGPAMLRLWVSSDTEDMDVFIAIRQIGPDGAEISGIGPRGAPIHMAVGWLRASHRELDAKRSLPYRPFHTHRKAEPLVPGEPVALDVEIWPTSIVLPPGHHLRLEIAADDKPMREGTNVFGHYDPEDKPAARFFGQNTIHTGGEYESYLLLPVIPANQQP